MLANMNVSGGYFFLQLLQIVLRKVRVHPKEVALPALAQPPTSGTLYLPRKGCLPPVISMSSSRSSMQRTGQPVLRETPEGKKTGVPPTAQPCDSRGENSREVFFVHLVHSAPRLCCLGPGSDKVGHAGCEQCPCPQGPHSQVGR